MNKQEDSETKSKNNRNLLIILAVAGVLLLCFVIILVVAFSKISSKSKSLFTSDEVTPTHYGVYVKQGGNLSELEERESFNIPTASDFKNLEVVTDAQPTIVIWRNNTNLDYLIFYKLGEHIGESLEIKYNATPKNDGIIEISPASPLENGEYCLTQGDPVGVSIPWWCFSTESTEAIIQQQAPSNHSYPSPNNSSLGDINAPVKMIVFCDFQSIYCGSKWEDTWQQLLANYIATGKVYFTYRSFGSVLGDESRAAAEAAYCAEDQGKFWEYHDLLFANLKNDNTGNFSDNHLSEFANSLNLDMKAFKKCFSEGKYSVRVQQDKIDADTAGAIGAPTFLVNGIRIDGAQPYETFSRAIENILNGK